jgi:hypothetical protein
MIKTKLLWTLVFTVICTSAFAQSGYIIVDSVADYKNKKVEDNGHYFQWCDYFSFHAHFLEEDRRITFTINNKSKLGRWSAGDKFSVRYSWGCPPIDYPLNNDSSAVEDINIRYHNFTDKKKTYSTTIYYKVHLREAIVIIDSVKRRKKYFHYITDVSRYQIDTARELFYRFTGSGKQGDKYMAIYDPLKPYHRWLILPTQAALDNSIHDTSVATVVPLRRVPINIDNTNIQHCDAFKIVFKTKDSGHLHTIKLPYYETDIPSGANIYANFPLLAQKREMYVVYDKKNTDNIRLITNPAADTGKFHYRKMNNVIMVNAIPTIMSVLSYERIYDNIGSIGVDWTYFLPNISTSGSYGFSDPGGATSFFSDIPNSMYKVGWANRVEFNLKFYTQDRAPRNFYIRLYYAYEEVKNVSQIYFNVPSYYGRISPDSSVTQFLASSPSHQVYYRQVSFNSQGGGFGLGWNIPIDRASRLFGGIEIGAEFFGMPNYAKQPVMVDGQQFYYQYTPAWESVLDIGGYGHINLVYRF